MILGWAYDPTWASEMGGTICWETSGKVFLAKKEIEEETAPSPCLWTSLCRASLWELLQPSSEHEGRQCAGKADQRMVERRGVGTRVCSDVDEPLNQPLLLPVTSELAAVLDKSPDELSPFESGLSV